MPKSTTPVPSSKPPAPPANRMPETESGEPDLLAISRMHERAIAAVAPPPEPVPQVIRVVEAAPRATTERKLLMALVVLLVAVNGYFIVTRGPEPKPAVRPPEPTNVVRNDDTDAPTEVRAAAVAGPSTPSDAAPPTPAAVAPQPTEAPTTPTTPPAPEPTTPTPEPAVATTSAPATTTSAPSTTTSSPVAAASPPTTDEAPVVDPPAKPKPKKPKPKAPRPAPDRPEPGAGSEPSTTPFGASADKPEPPKSEPPPSAEPTRPPPPPPRDPM
jgi:hypothetical protein